MKKPEKTIINSESAETTDSTNTNGEKAFKESNVELSSRYGSICWLNMIASGGGGSGATVGPEVNKQLTGSASVLPTGLVSVEASAGGTKDGASASLKPSSGGGEGLLSSSKSMKDPNNFITRCVQKLVTVFKWVSLDFRLRHLVWIKFIFFFQSASMTVLYPYLTLHMKSLGLSILETAVINAVIPILFIFTPSLAGFLAEKVRNFRILLSILTALGGIFALFLLAIPSARNTAPYPQDLNWGISCGRPTNRARYQKLMLHGFRRDDCTLKNEHLRNFDNITFTPGTCGYLCPTRSSLANVRPKFEEYKVIWPNRGGGFGIAEIVDVITLNTKEAREYHEPDVVDNNIFFPMNWTFHLSCDRIQTSDCIFNPIQRAPPANQTYGIQLKRVTSPFRSPDVGPSFDILSITPPDGSVPVSTPINCGAKEVVAQVVSTIDASSLGAPVQGTETLVDTRFSGCSLHCLVNVPRSQLCNNTHVDVTHDPSLTFWTYLTVRTMMGVLTAASLMMFEGAVMATVQEMGGDYGIQRFVGNFGAIVFAPFGGYIIDVSTKDGTGYEAVIYIYLALKLIASLFILLIKLDFKPPGERILSNISDVAKNVEVMAFLGMMMFAGTFWGYIESFLFWHLDDMESTKFLMGWTVAVGMITSLPFLIFSGPITDTIGHMNVIILGMLAYTGRMLGYSFILSPIYVYPFEALEGLTMALMMTSAVTYVAKISTPTTIASVMGLMGAVFFGVGKGSGSLFGGLIMYNCGARVTFQILSAVAALSALIYGFFQFLYVRPLKLRQSKLGAAAASSPSTGTVPQQTSNANNSSGGGGGWVNPAFSQMPMATSTPKPFQEHEPPTISSSGENGNGNKETLPYTITPSNTSPMPKTDEAGPPDYNSVNTGPRSITGGTRV